MYANELPCIVLYLSNDSSDVTVLLACEIICLTHSTLARWLGVLLVFNVTVQLADALLPTSGVRCSNPDTAWTLSLDNCIDELEKNEISNSHLWDVLITLAFSYCVRLDRFFKYEPKLSWYYLLWIQTVITRAIQKQPGWLGTHNLSVIGSCVMTTSDQIIVSDLVSLSLCRPQCYDKNMAQLLRGKNTYPPTHEVVLYCPTNYAVVYLLLNDTKKVQIIQAVKRIRQVSIIS